MKRLTTLFAFLLLFSACTKYKEVPQENIVYLQIGDSITYGEKNSPGNDPGNQAIRALKIPATYIKLGWPGETAREFNQKHRSQLEDSVKSIRAGHRIILGIAYGANDINQFQKEAVLADILRTARWATDTLGIKEVVLIPIMNRTDKFAYTRDPSGTITYHFDDNRQWVNTQLPSRATAFRGVRAAKEAASPRMFSSLAPADKDRFADQVHPNDLGAKELGEGTIVQGITGQ